MENRQSLIDLLSLQPNNKILLLGRENLFAHKEIARFLKRYNIEITEAPCHDTVASIESSRLNPVEEMHSESAYAMGIPSYRLEELEALMSEDIDDDALLMAVKLGNDQERILRMLGNPNLSDALFVRLLRMYAWDEEEEDSREDRNVIMHTLRRYIDIKPNEQDLLYSYLTLRKLASEAEDPSLLMALTGFHNFTFLVRGKERVTLREVLAGNRSITPEVIEKLLTLRDRRVEIALSANPAVPLEVLRQLIQKDDSGLQISMATNRGIDDALFEALLTKGKDVVEVLLQRQPVDLTRFRKIMQHDFPTETLALMAANKTLEREVLLELDKSSDPLLLVRLAANPTIEEAAIRTLYAKNRRTIHLGLAQNPQTPADLLTALQATYEEDMEMMAALAYNSALPEALLRSLYALENFEIHKGLATNKSLPRELLEVLKLDSRLQNYLAENEVLIQEYKKVFAYDEKSVIYRGE